MTNILLNKLSFIIQIYAAELLLTRNLKHKDFFLLKITASVIISLAIAFVFTVPYFNALYSSFMYLCLFSISIFFLKFCLNEPLVNVVFCGIAAYTTQHLAYEIANVIILLASRSVNSVVGNYASETITKENLLWTVLYELIRYLCCYTVYACCYIFYGKKISKESDLKIKNLKVFFLVAIGLFVDIVINSIVVYVDPPVLYEEYAYVYNLIIFVAIGFCCLLLLNVQFGLVDQRAAEVELEVLRHLWRQKKTQFEVAQENIDVINRKCHDMKHSIRNIGQKQKLDGDVINEITGAISVYDSMVKTGNDALDTVLTEKSLSCVANGITFNCVVDGKKAEFLKTADIYVLFGNVIDNAVEAVSKVEDKEKRVIDLVVYSKGDILTINVMNSYSGDLTFENGLPLTTKKDKYYHGFGIKSIKAIVDKYGGDLTLSADGSVFSLAIILPIVPRKKS